MYSSIDFRSSLRILRLLSKYYTHTQLDQQQKYSTRFLDSFSNPTCESGEVISNRFKLALSLVDKHYAKDSGFN